MAEEWKSSLVPPQLALLDGGGGHAGVTVFSGHVEFAQTYYDVVNQLGKMSSTLLIAS
jgi:hypothetical protein